MNTEPQNSTQLEVNRIALDAISKIQQLTTTAEGTFEQTVKPIRKSIIKRFPVVFLLLVTFGAAATAFGTEQIFLRQQFLVENPWITFSLGILTLVFTGTLYKKLG